MSGAVFRVQNYWGRGPYIPGFSRKWADDDGPIVKPWWDEIGKSVQDAILMLPVDMHIGCAFRSMEKLHEWFTDKELKKLGRLGFYIVKIMPDEIVCETPTQVVFATKTPLFRLAQHRPCSPNKGQTND